MIRVITIVALLTAVEAKRVQTHAVIQSVATNKFFESCEDFHGIFRSRVAGVQNLLDAHPNATGMNAMSRARFTMRAFGVVRTLRRAKDCPWVVDGNSEDIQQAQSIVQATLAGNPCAAAAMAELTPEAYEAAAHELIPLQRAMLVLVSDTCVVPELEVVDMEDEQATQDNEAESEERMQSTIDELFEEAALESEGGALLQSDSAFIDRVFAWIGAIFFAIVFGLACAVPAFFVGGFLGLLLGVLYCECCGVGPCQEGLGFVILGAYAGVPLGFATCAAAPILAVGQN